MELPGGLEVLHMLQLEGVLQPRLWSVSGSRCLRPCTAYMQARCTCLLLERQHAETWCFGIVC